MMVVRSQLAARLYVTRPSPKGGGLEGIGGSAKASSLFQIPDAAKVEVAARKLRRLGLGIVSPSYSEIERLT